MSRTLIVEVNGKMPFDAELDAVYDALSPEEQGAKLREIRFMMEESFRAEMEKGADVIVNVYVSEEGAEN